MKKVTYLCHILFFAWLMMPLHSYAKNNYAQTAIEKAVTTKISNEATKLQKNIVQKTTAQKATSSKAAIQKDKSETTSTAESNCLGDQAAYKKYPRATMKKIQGDLWTIYHFDPEWKSESDEKSQPLSDGIMGPITWSWMNRFCNNFALSMSADIIAELPDQLTRIVAFTETYPADSNILTSSDFSQWRYEQQNPQANENSTALYKGNDAQLLALIHRYQARNQVKPAEKPPALVNIETKAPNTLYVYTLRAEDLTKLQEPNLFPDAIKKLVNVPFATDSEADAAIAKALKSQPKEIKSKAGQIIHQQLTSQTNYQLSEGVLASLAGAGLTSVQISELNNVSKDVFTDEASFKKAITLALKNAEQKSAMPITNTESANASSGSATSIASQSNNEDQQAADQTVARIRVMNASKNSSLKLTEESAAQIISEFVPADTPSSLHPLVVKLLASMKNIEYPDGQLLHLAVQNKLIKGIDNCGLNKSNTLDTKTTPLTDSEKSELKLAWEKSTQSKEILAAIDEVFSPQERISNALPVCSESFYNSIDDIYTALIKPAIASIYRKDLPAYSNLPIQWSGKQCGCIPKEIESTAYGIYPYWHISDKEQNFDFSTFSRVAYYGMSFNSNGQLLQTNSSSQAKTVFNQDNEATYKFITTARTYGSKVDWMIEKDWNEELTGNDETDVKKIEFTLQGLRSNIIHLLTTPLTDAFSRFKSLTSLGLAQRPTKGDGVTLYFKNYPQSVVAKNLFDEFFTSLKEDLGNISYGNGRFHGIKENYFVNMVITQADFENPENVFNNSNLDRLLNIADGNMDNLTSLERQEKTKTLILVLLNEPYFNSLSEIYATTSANSRDIILPIMFMDYKNFDPSIKGADQKERLLFDERRKNLAFIQEGFGGGGFWSMPLWDEKSYEGFNSYLATQFALGYPQSWWAEKVCGYRWIIVAIMNLWLCCALIYVLSVFYIFPQRCKKLPGYLELLLHPAVLLALIFPPIAVWIYLLIVDHQYPFLSLPSLLSLVLLGLSCWAAYEYVTDLRKRKPTRNLGRIKNSQARVPTRSTK